MIERHYRPQALEFYRRNLEHPPDTIPSGRGRILLAVATVVVSMLGGGALALRHLPRLVSVQVDCENRRISGLVRPDYAGEAWLGIADMSVKVRLTPEAPGHRFVPVEALDAAVVAALRCPSPLAAMAMLP